MALTGVLPACELSGARGRGGDKPLRPGLAILLAGIVLRTWAILSLGRLFNFTVPADHLQGVCDAWRGSEERVPSPVRWRMHAALPAAPGSVGWRCAVTLR